MKLTLPDILTNYASTQQLNSIFQQIEDEFNNKVLYRLNPVGTGNTMSNDIDMNSYNIINVETLQAQTILLAGEDIAGLSVQVNFYAGAIAPTNIQEGDFWYSLTDNTLFYYNGTQYISLELLYNETLESETRAAASALEAQGYATNSLNSSVASENSAANSLSSAQAAALSETNAENSATASSNSAAEAANSAIASENSSIASAATLAEFEDIYLGNYATPPATAVSGAPLEAGMLYLNTADSNMYVYTGTAWTTVSNTATSDAAAASALSASDSATASASSASSASDSAATATSKATEANNSATASSTSATNALTSEQNAALSASNALASENAAATTYTNFDKRYLGQKASAPTVDNQGSALVTGALYFNTAVGDMYVYNGSTWVTVSNTASSDAANTSAINAANSATASANSATASASSATASANSASAASTSETNASTSATNAATSATTANTHRLSAEAARDLALGYKNSAEADALSAAQSATQAAAIALEDITPRYELEVKTSIQPTLSSNFSRNKHERYEVYGNEPKTILQQWDVDRNSTATYFDANGVLQTAAVNQPRIDYSTGEGRLLVEGQSTNLLLWSEDFGNSYWLKDTATVEDEGGYFSVVTSEANAVQGIRNTVNVFFNDGVRRSYFFYVKQISSEGRYIWIGRTGSQSPAACFDLELGASVGTNSFIEDVGDGWYIIGQKSIFSGGSGTLRIAANSFLNTSLQSYAASGQKAFAIKRAQLEQASSPSSYIPTQASQVTRLADTITPKGDE